MFRGERREKTGRCYLIQVMGDEKYLLTLVGDLASKPMTCFSLCIGGLEAFVVLSKPLQPPPPYPRTRRRRWACSFCQKTFHSSWHCQRHERIHTGLRPFRCKYCTKTFMYRDRIRQHEAIHSIDKRKVETCELCGETYLRAVNGKENHLRVCPMRGGKK